MLKTVSAFDRIGEENALPCLRTGLSNLATDLTAKRVQILQEIVSEFGSCSRSLESKQCKRGH